MKNAKQKDRTISITDIRKSIMRIYGSIFVVGILYVIWIKATGYMIPCMYVTTSGFLCPGCGTTRMLLSLLQLRFVDTYTYNPVTFCLFFFWNGIALLSFWGKWPIVRNKRVLFGCFYLSLAVMLGYWIVRNI